MRALIFFCLISFISPATFAKSSINLANGEWPPYLSESYKNYGAASDMVSQAFAVQGVEVNFGFFPWKRGYKLAKNSAGWHGTLVWTYSDDRSTDFYYSDPIIQLNDVFFHRRDTAFNWTSINDLKGLNIGATIGYFYGAEFERAEKQNLFSVDRVSTDITNFKKLLRGHIDAFPITLDVGHELLFNHFPEPVQKLIVPHRKVIRTSTYHLILSKRGARNSELLKKFNLGLSEIKTNGLYEKIIKRLEENWYRPGEE